MPHASNSDQLILAEVFVEHTQVDGRPVRIEHVIHKGIREESDETRRKIRAMLDDEK